MIVCRWILVFALWFLSMAGVPAAQSSGHQGPVVFKPDLFKSGLTSLAIFNEAGRMVRTVWRVERRNPGDQVEWDGRDGEGNPLPCGAYTYQLLQLPPEGIRPRHIATVGNGRAEDSENLGGVVGMIPFDVKTDPEGNIYLAGTAHGRSLQKFDRDGEKIWISSRPDPGRLDDQVSAIAVGHDFVYVAGPLNLWRVDIRSGDAVRWPDGEFGRKFGKQPPAFRLLDIDRLSDTQALWVDSIYQGTFWWASTLTDINGWEKPFHSNAVHDGRPIPVRTRGMALMGDELYISFFLEDRVEVRDSATGELRRFFSIPGPAGIVADPERNELLVVGRQAVYRCDTRGGHRRKIVSSGLSMPWGLARDVSAGKLYVADQFHDGNTGHKIKVFSENTGETIEVFGADDALDGRVVENELFAPTGLDVDPSGRILVAENLIYRVSVFLPDWHPALSIYGGAFFESAFADPWQPEIVYGIDGWMQGSAREYLLDYEKSTWVLNRFWYHGGPHPTRDLVGGAMYGSRIVKVDGVRYLTNSCDSLRVYRIDDDRLTPVTIIGHRYRVKQESGLFEPAGRMSIWVDFNGDELATPDEVSYAGDSLQGLPYFNIGVGHFDVDCEPDGTLYWGTFKLPLRGRLPNGALEYDWEDLEHFPTSFDEEFGNEVGISTDGDVRSDDRYQVLMTLDNDLKQPGLSLWSRRTKDCYARKYSKTGELMWQVGSKAVSVYRPGEMYHPCGIETIAVGKEEQTFVLINEEVGPVHIWSGEGLYVGTLLRDMSRRRHTASPGEGLTSYYQEFWEKPKWLSDPYASVFSEAWHISSLVHPVTKKVYLYTQAHEGGEHLRIYEILGLEQIVRTSGPIRTPN